MVVRHDRPEPWIVAEEPVGTQGGSVGDGQYQAVGASKGRFQYAVGYVRARVDYLHLPVSVLVYVVEHAGELFASVVSVCRNGCDDFGPSGTQAEEGAYKVEGSWEFSATTALDENNVPAPVIGYYTQGFVDGRWTPKKWHEGTTYSYIEGTSPAMVRLIWRSVPPPGMSILIR